MAGQSGTIAGVQAALKGSKPVAARAPPPPPLSDRVCDVAPPHAAQVLVCGGMSMGKSRFLGEVALALEDAELRPAHCLPLVSHDGPMAAPLSSWTQRPWRARAPQPVPCRRRSPSCSGSSAS